MVFGLTTGDIPRIFRMLYWNFHVVMTSDYDILIFVKKDCALIFAVNIINKKSENKAEWAKKRNNALAIADNIGTIPGNTVAATSACF